MDFRLSSPPAPNDLPAPDAELLALLLGRAYCQDRLSEAEEQENYPACAAWLKAVNSGLPVILNALVPQYAAVAAQHYGQGEPEAVLSDDVDSFEELLQVLRAVARVYRRDPHHGLYGMSINHPTRAHPYYSFAHEDENHQGVPALFYEGRFSS